MSRLGDTTRAGNVRDLPERLPEGETVLWQGAPTTRLVASHILHIRAIAAYFALAAAIQIGASLIGDGAFAARGAAGTVIAGVAALSILSALAWFTARTTLYTITNRRVVLRFGIALPVTLNLPFTSILSADLRRHRDGSGGIALSLGDPRRVLYATLWPHARPWRIGTPQPMLRGLADAGAVAQILAGALHRAQAGRVPVRLVSSTDAALAPAAA